jgi:hypothetical protein
MRNFRVSLREFVFVTAAVLWFPGKMWIISNIFTSAVVPAVSLDF